LLGLDNDTAVQNTKVIQETVQLHAPEKVDEKRIQKVDIIFNSVREINFLSATQPKQ